MPWFISPDYQLSKRYKKKLKGTTDSGDKHQLEETELANYICRNNTWNLIISAVLIIIVLSLAYLTSHYWLWAFLSGVLGYRILSRTVEINLAFFKDVCEENENKSNLSAQKRIRLAIKSLIEEALLFSGFYSLMSDEFSWNYLAEAVLNGARSFIPSLPDAEASNKLMAFMETYQAICSLILITLSIASYISRQGANNFNKKVSKENPEKDTE